MSRKNSVENKAKRRNKRLAHKLNLKVNNFYNSTHCWVHKIGPGNYVTLPYPPEENEKFLMAKEQDDQ